MKLQFDKTIKAGDILTSLTIALSVIALVLSLAKDRESRAVDQGIMIRIAAANAIVKLDRWQSVQLSLYQELKPSFVESSESLEKKYDVEAVRNKFWRLVNGERIRISHQLLDEQLGTTYLDILSHFPAARAQYIEAFSKLATVEKQVSSDFLRKSQQTILNLDGKRSTYQMAVLVNTLQAQARKSESELKSKSDEVIAPVRDYLLKIIDLPDEKIIDASHNKQTSNSPFQRGATPASRLC
ncbi:hypothetical protein [Sulfuricella sp.]|uniref:hypothetical protein n=1 Tax=Sulfuricella sp. TaxID=2099377 RepID=UPI002C5C6896|nr:hypothetical protein [Sulfuricella sp.]HUX62219.1 hypothetical protein [Sulfuricella sp.]